MYGAGWGNAPSGVPVSELPRRSSNGTIQPTSEGAVSRATAPPGSLNKAEVRAAMRFNERIRKAAHEALAPPPLHDFMTSAEAHGNSVWSWTGVPGKRLLRLDVDKLPSRQHAQEREPFGEAAPCSPPGMPGRPMVLRPGACVYEASFQNLPVGTSERLIMQLEESGDPSAELRPYYTPESSEDATLVFESRFESGNLQKATRVGDWEYDLELSADTNTRGHTQWFYFSVGNTRAGQTYRFNIVNLYKSESLSNSGLRPLLYSLAAAHRLEEPVGWRRAGNDISYYLNRVASSKRGVQHATLTFAVEMEFSHDTVYLAHCYPFTYRELQTYLHGLEASASTRRHLRRRVLCETDAGNACDVLTITAGINPGLHGVQGEVNEEEDDNSGPLVPMAERKAVVVSARVHPGETNASHMVKGLVDFLLSDEREARQLRREFVFKVVPMLNPDGVINGNYRCALAGHDMNRRWIRPLQREHAPIFHLKNLIQDLQRDRGVLLFCDLHGHSRKQGVFAYGCDPAKRDPPPADSRPWEKVFPFLVSQRCEQFSLHRCSYKVQRAKMGTGRVVACKELGVENSFTMEASFCGADHGPAAGIHFDIAALENMGRAVAQAVLRRFGRCTGKAQLEAVMRLIEEGQLGSGDAELVGDSDDGSNSSSSSSDEADQGTPTLLESGKGFPPQAEQGLILHEVPDCSLPESNIKGDYAEAEYEAAEGSTEVLELEEVVTVTGQAVDDGEVAAKGSPNSGAQPPPQTPLAGTCGIQSSDFRRQSQPDESASFSESMCAGVETAVEFVHHQPQLQASTSIVRSPRVAGSGVVEELWPSESAGDEARVGVSSPHTSPAKVGRTFSSAGLRKSALGSILRASSGADLGRAASNTPRSSPADSCPVPHSTPSLARKGCERNSVLIASPARNGDHSTKQRKSKFTRMASEVEDRVGGRHVESEEDFVEIPKGAVTDVATTKGQNVVGRSGKKLPVRNLMGKRSRPRIVAAAEIQSPTREVLPADELSRDREPYAEANPAAHQGRSMTETVSASRRSGQILDVGTEGCTSTELLGRPQSDEKGDDYACEKLRRSSSVGNGDLSTVMAAALGGTREREEDQHQDGATSDQTTSRDQAGALDIGDGEGSNRKGLRHKKLALSRSQSMGTRGRRLSAATLTARETASAAAVAQRANTLLLAPAPLPPPTDGPLFESRRRCLAPNVAGGDQRSAAPNMASGDPFKIRGRRGAGLPPLHDSLDRCVNLHSGGESKADTTQTSKSRGARLSGHESFGEPLSRAPQRDKCALAGMPWSDSSSAQGALLDQDEHDVCGDQSIVLAASDASLQPSLGINGTVTGSYQSPERRQEEVLATAARVRSSGASNVAGSESERLGWSGSRLGLQGSLGAHALELLEGAADGRGGASRLQRSSSDDAGGRTWGIEPGRVSFGSWVTRGIGSPDIRRIPERTPALGVRASWGIESGTGSLRQSGSFQQNVTARREGIMPDGSASGQALLWAGQAVSGGGVPRDTIRPTSSVARSQEATFRSSGERWSRGVQGPNVLQRAMAELQHWRNDAQPSVRTLDKPGTEA